MFIDYWGYPAFKDPPPPFTPPEQKLVVPLRLGLANSKTWTLNFYSSGFL